MKLEFVSISKENSALLTEPSRWNREYWADMLPDLSREDWDNFYDDCAINSKSHKLPWGEILLRNGIPVGTYAIAQSDDVPGYEHLFPWLVCLIVDPNLRGQGIGEKLVKRAELQLVQDGFKSCVLWTATGKDWYERLGWVLLDTPIFSGKEVYILKRELDETS